MNKRGQSVGLVTGLIFGIASLVIAIIIAFVIVGTLIDANLIADESITLTVTDEIYTTNIGAWINATGYTLDSVNATTSGYVIVGISNYSDGARPTITAANYTVSSTGVISNITNSNWNNVTVNYTYLHTFGSVEGQSVDALSANFSSGVNQVSLKIPTVLLVAAIVLILGVLAILLLVWQRMKMSSSSL